MKEVYKTPEKQRQYMATWYQKNRTKLAAERAAVKAQVCAMYGGACACCGITEPEFLTMDHVNGDGKERREGGERRGYSFYKWLLNQPIQPDLQLLCWNCNVAKRTEPTCPHQRSKA